MTAGILETICSGDMKLFSEYVLQHYMNALLNSALNLKDKETIFYQQVLLSAINIQQALGPTKY